MNTNELLEQIKAKLDETKAGPWNNTRIAASGTVSDAVDLGDQYAFLQVVIPTITSAQLELQVSDDLNGTYQDLGQDSLTKAGTGAYSETWVLGGWRYIKIKSSAEQTSAVVFQVRGVTDSAVGGVGGVDILSIAAGTNAIGKVGHDTTGLGHNVKTVTTVGTDEVLAASTACKWIIIQAQTDNTDKVAVGGSGVDATVATGNGISLGPGDSVTIITDNLADVYVDALVAGEGVRFTYGT